MKTYPHIPKFRPTIDPPVKLHTFIKRDGSNLRFEYSKKRGWHKYGTRTRLLDETDPVFGDVPKLFNKTIAEPLTKMVEASKWDRITAFCEYSGSKSFAGTHIPDDPKTLFLIDLCIHKKGFLSPDLFIKLFDSVFPLGYNGLITWDAPFAQYVYELSSMEEGFVGKIGEGHNIIRYKTKCKWWYDKVIEIHGEKKGLEIINS